MIIIMIKKANRKGMNAFFFIRFRISKPAMRQKKQQAVIIVEKPLESPELRALLAKMEKKIVVKDLKIEELERLISEKT
mgnify:CR=1 FL=1